jgi:hypothetical protein
MTLDQSLEIKRLLEGNFVKVKEMSDKVFVVILTDYDFATMQQVCIKMIKSYKFAPTIANIIEEYNRTTLELKNDVVEGMNKAGYFKCEEEYHKSLVFVESGVVPPFLQKMIQRYLNQNKLEHKLYLGEVK